VTCQTCGTVNLAGAKFCSECGGRLQSGCPNCGATNLPGAKFCSECGTHLEATATSGAPTASQTSAPGRPATTTERRLVTVLFADLVGFTSLAADRDSEAVRDLLSRYFDAAREVVERYGGTVEKFIGDAVMAVWGTPVAREGDAEWAVRAALDLLVAVRTLDSGADGRGLEARAGVLTGEVAVTLGATGQGMVAGDLVNTASRLQSVAPPGTVLVGEATQRAASSAIVFEAAGPQVLKGKTAPVPAWRALRVVAKRGGEGRSEGLEAPFVGRDDELRLLKDFFHATSRERRARLLSVTGVAGIGKSRLAWEFLKYIDGVLETVWWHEGRSPALGEGVTFWALGEMVRRRAGLAETDDESTTRERVAATLLEFVPDETERRWIEPALLTLLGFGDAAARSRDELFASWRTFFERVATEFPAVLVFEDLHWADPGLLDFIDHLLEWSSNSPIYVITLSRPELLERRPGWGAGRRNFVALSLEPLTEAAMRELLAGLVPGLPDRAIKAILDRAGGVPLYAVETVRMLVAEGKLEEADGAFRPVGDLGDLAVPETLHALIAARLDALDAGDRGLLQDASVLGQTFSIESLAELRGEPPEVIEARLRGLARREVLVLDTDPRSPERGQYGFAQALLREVAYSTLARSDRRTRHLAAARYFEGTGDDQMAGVLATHYLDAFLASPEGDEAVALAAQARLALRGAADRAVALGSHDQAIAYLERALTITTDPADEAELLGRVGSAAAAAGHFDAAETALRRAVAIERERADRPALVRATVALGQALSSAYLTDAALAVLEPAYAELGPELPDDPSVVAMTAQLARAYQLHEEPVRAIEWADRALVAAERLYLVPVIADAIITKGGSLALVGRVWEGLGLIRAGRLLADAYGLPALSLRAAISLSGHLAVHDPRAAVEVGRDSFDLSRRLGLRHLTVITAANGAEAALATGEWAWALEALREAGSVDLDVLDRATVECVQIEILAVRGDLVGDRLDELAKVYDPNDSIFGASLGLARLWAALAEGRFGDAHADGRRVAELSGLNRPYGLLWAGYAGVRAGRHDQAAAVLDDIRALSVRGPTVDAELAGLAAGVAALDQRWPEAVGLYTESARGLRELKVEFDLGLVLLAAAELAPAGDPFGLSAAEESLAIFTRLGARPFVAQHGALPGRQGPISTTARETTPADLVASTDPLASAESAPPA
jgi:class 3 adenylate cyclase/tetratricopeptide (TPR) repeat protein